MDASDLWERKLLLECAPLFGAILNDVGTILALAKNQDGTKGGEKPSGDTGDLPSHWSGEDPFNPLVQGVKAKCKKLLSILACTDEQLPGTEAVLFGPSACNGNAKPEQSFSVGAAPLFTLPLLTVVHNLFSSDGAHQARLPSGRLACRVLAAPLLRVLEAICARVPAAPDDFEPAAEPVASSDASGPHAGRESRSRAWRSGAQLLGKHATGVLPAFLTVLEEAISAEDGPWSLRAACVLERLLGWATFYALECLAGAGGAAADEISPCAPGTGEGRAGTPAAVALIFSGAGARPALKAASQACRTLLVACAVVIPLSGALAEAETEPRLRFVRGKPALAAALLRMHAALVTRVANAALAQAAASSSEVRRSGARHLLELIFPGSITRLCLAAKDCAKSVAERPALAQIVTASFREIRAVVGEAGATGSRESGLEGASGLAPPLPPLSPSHPPAIEKAPPPAERRALPLAEERLPQAAPPLAAKMAQACANVAPRLALVLDCVGGCFGAAGVGDCVVAPGANAAAAPLAPAAGLFLEIWPLFTDCMQTFSAALEERESAQLAKKLILTALMCVARVHLADPAAAKPHVDRLLGDLDRQKNIHVMFLSVAQRFRSAFKRGAAVVSFISEDEFARRLLQFFGLFLCTEAANGRLDLLRDFLPYYELNFRLARRHEDQCKLPFVERLLEDGRELPHTAESFVRRGFLGGAVTPLKPFLHACSSESTSGARAELLCARAAAEAAEYMQACFAGAREKEKRRALLDVYPRRLAGVLGDATGSLLLKLLSQISQTVARGSEVDEDGDVASPAQDNREAAVDTASTVDTASSDGGVPFDGRSYTSRPTFREDERSERAKNAGFPSAAAGETWPRADSDAGSGCALGSLQTPTGNFVAVLDLTSPACSKSAARSARWDYSPLAELRATGGSGHGAAGGESDAGSVAGSHDARPSQRRGADERPPPQAGRLQRVHRACGAFVFFARVLEELPGGRHRQIAPPAAAASADLLPLAISLQGALELLVTPLAHGGLYLPSDARLPQLDELSSPADTELLGALWRVATLRLLETALRVTRRAVSGRPIGRPIGPSTGRSSDGSTDRSSDCSSEIGALVATVRRHLRALGADPLYLAATAHAHVSASAVFLLQEISAFKQCRRGESGPRPDPLDLDWFRDSLEFTLERRLSGALIAQGESEEALARAGGALLSCISFGTADTVIDMGRVVALSSEWLQRQGVGEPPAWVLKVWLALSKRLCELVFTRDVRVDEGDGWSGVEEEPAAGAGASAAGGGGSAEPLVRGLELLRTAEQLVLHARAFLAAPSAQVALAAHVTLLRSLACFANRKNSALPLVHKMWAPLVAAQTAGRQSPATAAVALCVAALCVSIDTYFVSQRLAVDLVPHVRDLLAAGTPARQADEDRRAQKHKMQEAALGLLGMAVGRVTIPGNVLEDIVFTCAPYVSSGAGSRLRLAAEAVLRSSLRTNEPLARLALCAMLRASVWAAENPALARVDAEKIAHFERWDDKVKQVSGEAGDAAESSAFTPAELASSETPCVPHALRTPAPDGPPAAAHGPLVVEIPGPTAGGEADGLRAAGPDCPRARAAREVLTAIFGARQFALGDALNLLSRAEGAAAGYATAVRAAVACVPARHDARLGDHARLVDEARLIVLRDLATPLAQFLAAEVEGELLDG